MNLIKKSENMLMHCMSPLSYATSIYYMINLVFSLVDSVGLWHRRWRKSIITGSGLLLLSSPCCTWYTRTLEILLFSDAEIKQFQGDMCHDVTHTDSAGGQGYLKFYGKRNAAKYAEGDSSCVVKMHNKGELTKVNIFHWGLLGVKLVWKNCEFNYI